MFFRKNLSPFYSLPTELIISILRFSHSEDIWQLRFTTLWLNKIVTRSLFLDNNIITEEFVLHRLRDRMFYSFIKKLPFYQITQKEFIKIINYSHWSPKERLMAFLQICDREDANHSDVVTIITQTNSVARHDHKKIIYNLIEKFDNANTTELVNRILTKEFTNLEILPYLPSQYLCEAQITGLLDIALSGKISKIKIELQLFLSKISAAIKNSIYHKKLYEAKVPALHKREIKVENLINFLSKNNFLYNILSNYRNKLKRRISQHQQDDLNKLIPLVILLPTNDDFQIAQLMDMVLARCGDSGPWGWQYTNIELNDKIIQSLNFLAENSDNFYPIYLSQLLSKAFNLNEFQVEALLNIMEKTIFIPIKFFAKLATYCNNNQLKRAFNIVLKNYSPTKVVNFLKRIGDKKLAELLKEFKPQKNNLKIYLKLIQSKLDKFPETRQILLSSFEKKFCLFYYKRPEMSPKKRIKKFFNTLNNYSTRQIEYVVNNLFMTKYAIRSLDMLTEHQLMLVFSWFNVYFHLVKEGDGHITYNLTFRSPIFVEQLLAKLPDAKRCAWLTEDNIQYIFKDHTFRFLRPIVLNYLSSDQFNLVIQLFIDAHSTHGNGVADLIWGEKFLYQLCLKMNNSHISRLLSLQQNHQLHLPFVMLDYFIFHKLTICKLYPDVFLKNKDFICKFDVKLPSSFIEEFEASIQLLKFFLDLSNPPIIFKNIMEEESSYSFSNFITLCKAHLAAPQIEYMINTSYEKIMKGYTSSHYFDVLKNLPTPVQLYFDLLQSKESNFKQYLSIIRIIMQLTNLSESNCQIIFSIAYNIFF